MRVQPSSEPVAARRPSAGQREAVREVVVAVARDALAVHDELSFKRLLESLDERAVAILRVLGRA